MVSRTWRAWTRPGAGDGFQRHLERTGIAEARELPGYQGHLLLREDDHDGGTQFTLISLWTDTAAERDFAGATLDAARAYPGDEEWLIAADERVSHADVTSADLVARPDCQRARRPSPRA